MAAPSPANRTGEMRGDVRALAEISRLARLATAGAVPEAIRRCRRAAAQHGATRFALFFTGRGIGSARLVHCFDEEFPGVSKNTAAIVAAGSDILSRHAAQSAVPACWNVAGGVAGPFVTHLSQDLTEEPGLALPVSADSGQTGLFVFTGQALSLDDMQDLHMLCYEVFASVAVLRTGSASSASAVSKRELECLKLTAAGRTSEDIARILGLSVHTANQYLTSAGAKLDAVKRMQAVAKAIRLGLIE